LAVRSAFQTLLEKCGSQFDRTLIAEYPLPRSKGAPLKVDGALLDEFRLKRGLWEAKDEHDDLEKEAKRKIAVGYPTDNIIFQAPDRAILYQNGARQGLNEDISSPANLVDLLHHFFEYRQPQHQAGSIKGDVKRKYFSLSAGRGSCPTSSPLYAVPCAVLTRSPRHPLSRDPGPSAVVRVTL